MTDIETGIMIKNMAREMVSALSVKNAGMTMKQFIEKNKSKIDQKIKAAGGSRYDDRERELWINSDYELYKLAQSQGVNFD